MGQYTRKRRRVILVVLLTVATGFCVYDLADHLAFVPAVSVSLTKTFVAPSQEAAYKDMMENRYTERRDYVAGQCQDRSPEYYSSDRPNININNYLLDDKRHVVFCLIPKNACSFWKRVFYILEGNHNESGVFNVSGNGIHSSYEYSSIRRYRSVIQTHHVLQSSKKIMFVRDPYVRLFSGYVDKFFSPCALDREQAKIMRLLRASNVTASCQPGLTFTEFLQYVANQTSVSIDQHFIQQYQLCQPCYVNYDYIGRLETFQQDAEYILKEAANMGLGQLLGTSDDFVESSDLSIIDDVAERTFKGCHFSYKCVSAYNVLLRTWITFQIRGYISVTIKMPVTSSEDARQVTLTQFQAMARKAYLQSQPDRAKVKEQRRQALLEAYYSVPRSLLQRVQGYVSKDCQLFGYQCDIEERFNLSWKPAETMFNMNEALEADIQLD